MKTQPFRVPGAVRDEGLLSETKAGGSCHGDIVVTAAVVVDNGGTGPAIDGNGRGEKNQVEAHDESNEEGGGIFGCDAFDEEYQLHRRRVQHLLGDDRALLEEQQQKRQRRRGRATTTGAATNSASAMALWWSRWQDAGGAAAALLLLHPQLGEPALPVATQAQLLLLQLVADQEQLRPHLGAGSSRRNCSRSCQPSHHARAGC